MVGKMILVLIVLVSLMMVNVSALLIVDHDPYCDAFGHYRCCCTTEEVVEPNTPTEIEKECAAWGHYRCMCGHTTNDESYNPRAGRCSQ